MANSGSPVKRCPWCGEHADYIAYHDDEWGVPVTDDTKLFEMLTLEGAQAGLSWLTILRKREGYRRAFKSFDLQSVAAFSEADKLRLRQDPSIVRNRLKIDSTVSNAQAILAIKDQHDSFASYLWSFVDGIPIQNGFQDMSSVPAKTPLAERLSRDLKKKGFRFVGPTIIYAFMQAAGLVNDHFVDCFRHADVAALGGRSVI